MKIMFYTLRPFDEQQYCEPYKQQYGIDYTGTPGVPTPENLHLAEGCDAVSTNPCEIRPEYLEAWARMGVKYLPCRSIGYDHIPLDTAKKLGMRISHSHYPPEGVANYTIMLILMCTRKMNQLMLRANVQDYVLLVNTARGTLIDPDALVAGLECGKIGGAGLDVIEDETGICYYNCMGEAIPNRELNLLRSYPNVILSPHTAFYPDVNVANMVKSPFEALDAYAHGRPYAGEVQL